MKALISAGGKGTRLIGVTNDEMPKPMAALLGKPIIGYAVDRLRENGVTDITVSVGHLHQKIIDYLGDGRAFGVKIDYIIENTPLGSAGALYYFKAAADGDFVICSGDTVFDIDISRMLGFHRRNDAGITLFTHPNAHPYDSDLVSADYGGRVRGIIKKGGARSGLYYGNNVNAGFFIVNPRTLGFFDTPEEVGMEHDFVGALIDGGERVFAYKSTEYIKDAGTPSRFDSVAADIKSGTVSGKNLKNKQRAVFLDRDGTVNKYKGFISDAAQIELTDRAAEAIRLINKSGYLAIVVSNQPVIARGEATAAEVEKMHKKIETLLGAENAYLDDILYCPHHPDSGYPGEVAALKIKCDCRKPGTGMFIVAVEKYNIDLKASCMIGDSDVDVEAGHNAGMPAVRINSGLAERGSEAAENRAENLLDAVKIFLGGDL